MMGAALVALTLSIVWVGRKIPLGPVNFPGLITLSVTSDIINRSAASGMLLKSGGIHGLARTHRCPYSRPNSATLRTEPKPPAPSRPQI